MIQRTAHQEEPTRDRSTGSEAVAPAAAVAAPNSALAQLLSGIGAPWATALLQNLSVSNGAAAEALDPAALMQLATDMDAEPTEAAPGGAAPAAAPVAAPAAPPLPATQLEVQAAPVVTDEPSAAPAAEIPATGGASSSPAEDPAFVAVVSRMADSAAQERAHMPARGAAMSAQNAAPGPANQVTSGAASRQAQRLEQTPTPGFDRAGFKARLLEQIAAAAPKTSKEAKNFPSENRMGKAKEAMAADAARAGDVAQGGLRQQAQQPPDTAGIAPKPTAALDVPQPGAAPASVQATDAAPKPRADADVNLPFWMRNYMLEQQMAEAGITEEQLNRSNEPTFVGAVQAKREAKAHGEQAPQTFRQSETETIAQAQTEAEGITQNGLGGMYDARVGLLGQVATAQEETMTADQEQRAQVAAQIEAIYQTTSQRVAARLQQMDEEIKRVFDAGAEAARTSFESYVDEKIDDRYSGLRGKWRWLKDKVLSWGLAAPVAKIFTDARERYLAQMEGVIDQVVGVVERGITDGRTIVAEGRQEIVTYVESLPAALQNVGQQAAANIQSRFDGLEGSIDAKQNELVDTLTTRYVEQVTAIDSRIEELESEHSSFVSRAYNAVKGVIEAILRLKDLVLGILSRVADAIGAMISDPIGFLGNFVSGIKSGLDNFFSRVWEHLSNALKEWLFGALGNAGITLPDEFDAAGILDLVMQVLGLTKQGIRERAVRLVGEDIVAKLEEFAEPFIVLIRDGPGALWDWIAEQLTNLKDKVLGDIQNWVITKVIKSGLLWIGSLLNPATAFIKACKAIYEIVVFFIERGSQIVEMVDAILDSISAIAKGGVSAVANKVENALARALPVVIGFLASLLNLGGISEQIRSIIETVRAPVTNAVDWLIEKAVGLVRAAGKLLGLGPDDAGSRDTDVEPSEMQAPPPVMVDERSEHQKIADLDTAVGLVEELMQSPDATAESVESALPGYRDRYRLAQLSLVREDETTMHIEAVINPRQSGRGIDVLSRQQLRALDANARDFATEIRRNNHVAQFRADPDGYVTGDTLNIGAVVEDVGLAEVLAYVSEDSTVLRNIGIQMMNTAGESIGGRQAELDYLILGNAAVKEIISAKWQRRQFQPTVDRDHIRHYMALRGLNLQDLIKYAFRCFGAAPIYNSAGSAHVIFTQEGSQEELHLDQFVSHYMSKTVVDEIKITPMTPADGRTHGISLAVTATELRRRLIDRIAHYL